MRARDILALIALVIVAVVGELMRGDDTPSPDPQSPYAESPRRPAPHRFDDNIWDKETRSWMSDAPAPSNSAPAWRGLPASSVIDIPTERQSGTGTAFAVADGVWLTARHVVDGCDKVGIQLAPKRALKAIEIHNHPNADVSLIRTNGGPDAFDVSGSAGDDVFMLGFPASQPGAVHGRKLGTTILKERGRYHTRETANVWAERSRIPDRDGSLGGLSGGPAFGADGRISGVVLAEDRRRGRVITAQPQTLQAMFDIANATPSGGQSVEGLSATGYPRVARDLLLSLRVARVLCRVS